MENFNSLLDKAYRFPLFMKGFKLLKIPSHIIIHTNIICT